MKTSFLKLRAIVPAVVAGAALVAMGCTESTTREDVADAREELEEERQDVTEAQREGKEEIADAQDEAREHTVGKPVADDDAADARLDVAEAKQDAAAEIAEEKSEAADAAAELKTTEQLHQATQERDAYVKEVEKKLADMETQIEDMKEKADAAEGAEKDAINLKIEKLESQHEIAEDALESLKSADLASWKNHQQHVRTAMNDLDTTVNTR